MMRRRDQRNESEIEDNKDMLSDLPDCVLLHILSFLNAKECVQTCLLSTRWKHLWKHLSTLNLSPFGFTTFKCFSNFVNHILSHHESSAALKVLDFERLGSVEPCLLETIVRYAASHNVNRLRLACNLIKFPPFFAYPSLTTLELGHEYAIVIFPNSLNLPALTYLKLQYVVFLSENCVEPFSTFKKLNTLVIDNCSVRDAEPLYISSTTLFNLSIYSNNAYRSYSLFTPSLHTIAITCNSFPKLSGTLSSIIQVSIVRWTQVRTSEVETTLDMLNWLIEMTHMKSLTICPKTLQALSLVPDILKLKLPSLCNLKSIKLNVSCNAYKFSISSWRDIKMELARDKSWKENAKLREAIKAGLDTIYSSIIDGMIEFLLQNSPSAKVDVASMK